MTYTGGPLNELNGKMGISAPHKSVPVMKLIKEHGPKSKAELVYLVQWHADNQCSCGVKSQGTIAQFGRNLYESQMEYWGAYRYSLQECVQWEYDLFVVQSLKGGRMEQKAVQLLRNNVSDVGFEEAIGYWDEEFRIDILIKKRSAVVGGIQVKPTSFNYMRDEVIDFNHDANKKWGKPVWYLFYDEREAFTNSTELISRIGRLIVNV